MVFIGGPRQVGKTTLAQSFLKKIVDGHPAYISWDNLADRKIILEETLPKNQSLIIYDEIHKYSKWRSLVKGMFDKFKRTRQFIVTGSARLDHYRKGGDSLLGRYHYLRLHPLSLAEVSEKYLISDLNKLLKFGGFPEPFLIQDVDELKRWHSQRKERIVYQDIRDLENVKEISNIEILMHSLPERIGSPLSRKNLAQNLQVDFKTVEKWLVVSS